MSLVEELRVAAARLEEAAAAVDDHETQDALSRLEAAATDVGRAWSGSSLGYHARIYYADFQIPPPGAHFDSEWGFLGEFQGTTGDWREYLHDDVISLIRERAGNPDTARIAEIARRTKALVEDARAEILSVLEATVSEQADRVVERLRDDADKTAVFGAARIAQAWLPRGQVMTRDTTALSQGLMVAPHQDVLAEVIALRGTFERCRSLAKIGLQAATHLERLKQARSERAVRSGQQVFIGHGRSGLWRELKDLVSDRLGLPWDEFNRVPVAGITNIGRLSQMLDSTGIAFLVLTAEDETADGEVRARQNVIHEAGLFQGRLGFERAIVMLEEGCEAFSNIEGLGQIRFPTGRISAAFEEVRQVLEREGFFDT
jgi:predicted nucleotide-binding protein